MLPSDSPSSARVRFGEEGHCTVGRLHRRGRIGALTHLRRYPRNNLFLIDLTDRVGTRSAAGEPRPRVLVAQCRGEVVGIASVRPTVALDAALTPRTLGPFLPELAALPMGLVRSSAPGVERLWAELARRGRRALVDRTETAFLLTPDAAHLSIPPTELCLRPAGRADLDALIEAARESLREEGRPDPFVGDPGGFRRWVRERLPRAVVGEAAGKIAFVGYADVRRSEGWLLQGVYTWPAWRRRGLAAAGVSELCRAAFSGGADHVQLSVVEGNDAAARLYEQLGFRPFDRIRTLLFA